MKRAQSHSRTKQAGLSRTFIFLPYQSHSLTLQNVTLGPCPFPAAAHTWERCRGQEPSFRLHHVPVAEEDEASKVEGAVPLHILYNVFPAQGAGVTVLHRPHPNVPSHGQEGHLQGRWGLV